MEDERESVEHSSIDSAIDPTTPQALTMSRRAGDLSPHEAWQISGFSPKLLSTIVRPPVLSTENQIDYYRLLKRVSDLMNPSEWIERLLVKDYVDITWELLRLGRAKTEIINMSSSEALREILKSIIVDQALEDEVGEPDQLAIGWPSDPEKRQNILEILARHSLNEGSITAYAITLRSAEIQCLNTMIAAAESRRRAIVRDIEHYRKGFSALLRTAGELTAAE
jgi:hypothetical protein